MTSHILRRSRYTSTRAYIREFRGGSWKHEEERQRPSKSNKLPFITTRTFSTSTMLSHLKARESTPPPSDEGETAPAGRTGTAQKPPAAPAITAEEQEATRATCDVLCSLGAATSFAAASDDLPVECDGMEKQRKGKSCPKQHQLPMFLSSKSILVNTCCAVFSLRLAHTTRYLF